MKELFIVLNEYDTNSEWSVNVRHIERFADNEIWINSKRFKVKQSREEIQANITYNQLY